MSVDEEKKSSFCPVCNSPITISDEIIICPSCSIKYHRDCWNENFGCATFGCDRVDHLKPPPLRLDSILKGKYESTENEEPAWHYLCLGVSAVAILPSLFTSGIPSFFILIVTFFIIKHEVDHKAIITTLLWATIISLGTGISCLLFL